ncbi:hypothetical protein C0992_012854 [Termitomyces sp. T32_za158]|nr:hypothetical protein C0992_012854 [Termitomyces sp. T32_za158]
MAFYCSQGHWDAVKNHHVRGACEDGYDDLTQCQMNQEIQKDVVFANIMANASPMEFSWAPERIKPSWESLKNKSWDSEYASGIMEAFGLPVAVVGPFVRGASIALSMPMTILHALEHLNCDDQWTRKVLGASQLEIHHARIFEEILHRLPEVKTLELVFCGPELSKLVASNEIIHDLDMETCEDCATLKRKRVQRLAKQYVPQSPVIPLLSVIKRLYHDYAKSLGDTFMKPDLAVAFNSGLSAEDASSWKDTISFLITSKIPTVFTAYNREEAEAEARILHSAGANLIPELGPISNTWRSISFKKEPQKVIGFYSVNGWLAGGFRSS